MICKFHARTISPEKTYAAGVQQWTYFIVGHAEINMQLLCLTDIFIHCENDNTLFLFNYGAHATPDPKLIKKSIKKGR